MGRRSGEQRQNIPRHILKPPLVQEAEGQCLCPRVRADDELGIVCADILDRINPNKVGPRRIYNLKKVGTVVVKNRISHFVGAQ